MKITTIENREQIPTAPYAIQFADGSAVLILKDESGIVIKEGTRSHPLGTFRNDWCVDNLSFNPPTAQIWHGKIEIEIEV